MHLTETQIATLRADVGELAAALGCTAREAWDKMSTPDYVYAACSAAADAAEPAPKLTAEQIAEQLNDLLGTDFESPARRAASDAEWAEIVSAVCAE